MYNKTFYYFLLALIILIIFIIIKLVRKYKIDKRNKILFQNPIYVNYSDITYRQDNLFEI